MNIENFWSNVGIKEENMCWEWKLSKGTNGYGQVKINGINMLSHRIAYQIYHNINLGKGNKNNIVRHVCDNPPCCNPHHLLLGTTKDNNRDCINRNRYIHASGEKWSSTKLKDINIIEIRELFKEGLGIIELARNFNVSAKAIRRVLCAERKSLINQENLLLNGNKNRLTAKLTWEKVGEIRELSKKGEKTTTLAKTYEVSGRTICDILNGRYWKC